MIEYKFDHLEPPTGQNDTYRPFPPTVAATIHLGWPSCPGRVLMRQAPAWHQGGTAVVDAFAFRRARS
jgi:hypothetical protein